MSQRRIALALGTLLLGGSAHAAVVVVSGVVVNEDGGRQGAAGVSLCWTGRKDRSCKAKVKTSDSGVFLLTLEVASLPDRLYVVSDGPGWGDPVPVTEFSDPSGHGIHSAIADDMVVGRCSAAQGATQPAQVPRCIGALGATHRVRVLAGSESVAQADERFQAALRPLLDGVKGWDPRAVRSALDGLEKPFGGRDLPALASARSFELPGGAREMFASNQKFCSPLVKVRELDLEHYHERSDRCEGAVVNDTAGAVELVSLTEGPFAFEPEKDAIELRWPDAHGSDVCMRARPTQAGLGWLMNTRVPAGQPSFRWDTQPARKFGLAPGALGVVAEECGHGSSPVYLPLRTRAADRSAPYEAVLLASHKLKDVFVTIHDLKPDGTKRLAQPRARTPFTNSLRPRINVTIPREQLGPGKYLMTLQIYGVTDQGDGTLSFSFLHD